ncbi:sulfurtransferase complex subunit TusB [Buchnera aphidicola]|uniref:Protein TusB n=1 Tax=Buchnera aphidicola (Cinara strobi) TaxID=1921549 RepID=A0A3B1E9M9_9GAMM|nr:sulfurtransferase complex subunit TusB [Buchnera aphidicola]VAX76839.1 Protein TusB [Buchnera aphidicola (Cinara strobi)]
MLHILLNSPYKISQLSLFSLSSIFDDLICIQDGVILSIANDLFFKNIYKNFNLVYFLKHDLIARGLLTRALENNLLVISYQCFVFLTLGHNKSITW